MPCCECLVASAQCTQLLLRCCRSATSLRPVVVRSGLSRPELLPETEELHNSLLEALLSASDAELKQAGVVAQLPALEQVRAALTLTGAEPDAGRPPCQTSLADSLRRTGSNPLHKTSAVSGGCVGPPLQAGGGHACRYDFAAHSRSARLDRSVRCREGARCRDQEEIRVSLAQTCWHAVGTVTDLQASYVAIQSRFNPDLPCDPPGARLERTE